MSVGLIQKKVDEKGIINVREDVMKKYVRLFFALMATALCGAFTACGGTGPSVITDGSETPLKDTASSITEEPVSAIENFTATLASSKSNWWGCGVQYTRLVTLSDGTLLATFEQLNSGLEPEKPGYPIYRSEDGGKTWKLITTVRDTDKILQSEWNPFLIELTKPLGNYPAGTVLLAGCSVDAAHSSSSAIRLYASLDGGNTFGAPITVASAGGLENGVWEPFLMQLDDGRLVCFYSDDADAVCSQKIVYRISEDGVTFGEPIDVVASSVHSERPGMAVVTRLGDGSYFMVYEVVDHRLLTGNPIMYRLSKDGLDWGDPEFIGNELVSVDGKALGSAPYCAWTPLGGEKGTLVVSGTFMRLGVSKTGTDLFISRDNGASWTTAEHPIPYDASVTNVGYSNCIAFSGDGRIMYALNNPTKENNDGRSEIVFAAKDGAAFVSDAD